MDYKLLRENVRVGENLRQAILRARARDANLTNKSIAQAAGIHPVHLSRIIGGFGASEATISRLAEVIGADAQKILSKGTRRPLYSVRCIEDVISDEAILYQFIGGGNQTALDWAKQKLFFIFDQCRKHRSNHQEG